MMKPVDMNDRLVIVTVHDFLSHIHGHTTDKDGYGVALRDGEPCCQKLIKPSGWKKIPKNATHIVWIGRGIADHT